MTPVRSRSQKASTFALAFAATALLCSRVEAQPVTLTVDASEGWAFVSLATGEKVDVADPGASTAWDIAFLGTEVMLNGGSTGPGGFTAYCICQNRAASNDEIQFMTADGEAAAFDRVGVADIPADPDAWHPATFADQLWYRYNLRDEHFIWSLFDVYLLKRGDDVYKFQITGYYGRAGEPRQITFRYAPLPG